MQTTECQSLQMGHNRKTPRGRDLLASRVLDLRRTFRRMRLGIRVNSWSQIEGLVRDYSTGYQELSADPWVSDFLVSPREYLQNMGYREFNGFLNTLFMDWMPF